MAVDKNYRNHGVAKILMVAAVEQFIKDGCMSSHLIVTQFGMMQTPHLESFYNRVGFIHQTTRFLTFPVLYKKRSTGEEGEEVQVNNDDMNIQIVSPPIKKRPPRTGLYTLHSIPNDYALKVFS